MNYVIKHNWNLLYCLFRELSWSQCWFFPASHLQEARSTNPGAGKLYLGSIIKCSVNEQQLVHSTQCVITLEDC